MPFSTFVKTGCQWQHLPHDFPPYSTVHSFYRRARLSGLWDEILQYPVFRTREDAWRKRHIIVDVMENLLAVVVHAANIHDTKSGIRPAKLAFDCYPSIKNFALMRVIAELSYLKRIKSLALVWIYQKKSSRMRGKSFLGVGLLNALLAG